MNSPRFGLFPRARRSAAAVVLLVAAVCAAPSQPPPILTYIRQTWGTLTRSNRGLATAAVDPKLHAGPDHRWPVYISRTEDVARVEAQLRNEMKPGDFAHIELRVLPADFNDIHEHGLLYLPRPYVVPGGRFNEMYGWDSFFIQVGLLRDGEIDLARDMAENFTYEIREYGKILNANRTYYLGRSQPPFYTEMLLGVYERTHDRQWLANAVPALEKYYRFWMSDPHLTAETGLSRYYDVGIGPAPEALADEVDAQGLTHYDRVKQYYRTHQVPDYDVSQYYDRATNQLTPLYYTGDRSVREGGFDPSNRYGPFSVDIIHYDPVCLNSLLYLMESQTGQIMSIVGREGDAGVWRHRAQQRAERINRLMWDPQDGLYYDYNFVQRKIRRYPFLSTFYPLWAGIASKEQASRVVANLPKFECPGGLMTSTFESGNQWDAPFGWAPLHLIAVQGLRHYGFSDAADRITMEFDSVVRDSYRRQGFIVEKYDVVRRGTEVGAIVFGYSANQAGFGWTNATFTALYDELPAALRLRLLPAEGGAKTATAR